MTRLMVGVASETRPLAKPFVIARESIGSVTVVTVRLEQGGHVGRGEACPVPHFGESPAQVLADAREICRRLQDGASWVQVHDETPPGAARNAVDCAVWDLRAKTLATPAWRLAELSPPEPLEALYTIGIDSPDRMADAARIASRSFSILKVKLGGADDATSARAVRGAAPAARLIADVNEGWTREDLVSLMPVMAQCGFEMIEQPLPAGRDRELADIPRLLPIGADESCHTRADLERIAPFYDMVNIKLDKTGGLTEALRLREAAWALGLDTMVGCMLGTSLAMAPALLVAQRCRYVDLDAPLLIGSDCADGLTYSRGLIHPASAALWG